MGIICFFLLLLTLLGTVISGPVPLTPENAERLAKWTPADGPIWQISGQFQGDIVLRPGQLNGISNPYMRWPGGIIPYELSKNFTEEERQLINSTLESEFSKTCVTFRPREPKDWDYVSVKSFDSGCWSEVGYYGGVHSLNLQKNGCMDYKVIAHEFLHTAGFYHQQSAPERDDYVKINWENILGGTENNFLVETDSTSFGVEYDYGSVMHYDAYAFSKNSLPTITPHDPNAVIGKAPKLSEKDILKLNKMYGCT